MQITVLAFAAARDALGGERVGLELPAAATVGTALGLLVQRHPALVPLVSTLRVAVDADFASADTPLVAGATLALLPPVSGG
jgi:molybdopterin converting factor small subunit